MDDYVEQLTINLQKYEELCKDLSELQLKYVFLYDINNRQECLEKIEKCDNEISLLIEKIAQINKAYKESVNPSNELYSQLEELKQKHEDLNNKSKILHNALKLYIQIEELRTIMVNSGVQKAITKRDKNNKDIHKLFAEAKDMEELKVFIDAVCISIYHVPLLVALITMEPSKIENDFQVSGLSQELRKNIISYIEQKKIEISKNIILSDKALIDLIENVSGKNIANEQKRNERVSTGYNSQFYGQALLDKGKEYSLLRNDRNGINQHTTGIPIKSFDDNGLSFFDRKDSDMLVQNYPNAITDNLLFKSFASLSSDERSRYINVVISNLELCYEMFKSYYLSKTYLSKSVEIPVIVNLTNGKEFVFRMQEDNISHILGIPPIRDKNGNLKIPPTTIKKLGLAEVSKASALEVLESIISHKETIIRDGGLNYNQRTNTFYEMLPWEKIILKTNAFIRGDFFKTTSLITPVNPNSFLIDKDDEIKRISITPTKFGESAINQSLIDPNIPFEESIDPLLNPKPLVATHKSNSDFTFKGMIYDKDRGIWIPKTNESAIGERIKPYNADTLKTLEKYRYLLSGVSNPAEGGFVASVSSFKENGPLAEHSLLEMMNTFSEIVYTFATTEEIQKNLYEYLYQLQQLALDRERESRSR